MLEMPLSSYPIVVTKELNLAYSMYLSYFSMTSFLAEEAESLADESSSLEPIS